jgi:hypothetical protein
VAQCGGSHRLYLLPLSLTCPGVYLILTGLEVLGSDMSIVVDLLTTATVDIVGLGSSTAVVNHNAVNSATPGQNAELEDILKEMKSVKISTPGEEHTALAYILGSDMSIVVDLLTTATVDIVGLGSSTAVKS